MTNLFISLFNNPVRNKEYHECLRRNSKSGLFDNIFVIAEGDENWFDYLPSDVFISILPINTRPTFRSFFNAINVITGDDDINIIANSDIYFKDIPFTPRFNECFALTRYEPTFFLNRADSQDVWMFRGRVNLPQYCDFGMGVPGCDNRISYELRAAGYEVTNPSLSIKTYHLHKHPTDHSKAAKRIAPPYLKLTPCSLEKPSFNYKRIEV